MILLVALLVAVAVRVRSDGVDRSVLCIHERKMQQSQYAHTGHNIHMHAHMRICSTNIQNVLQHYKSGIHATVVRIVDWCSNAISCYESVTDV
jgi:hypothetical protein